MEQLMPRPCSRTSMSKRLRWCLNVFIFRLTCIFVLFENVYISKLQCYYCIPQWTMKRIKVRNKNRNLFLEFCKFTSLWENTIRVVLGQVRNIGFSQVISLTVEICELSNGHISFPVIVMLNDPSFKITFVVFDQLWNFLFGRHFCENIGRPKTVSFLKMRVVWNSSCCHIIIYILYIIHSLSRRLSFLPCPILFFSNHGAHLYCSPLSLYWMLVPVSKTSEESSKSFCMLKCWDGMQILWR